jgi:ATP-dependent DNA helicase RecG
MLSTLPYELTFSQKKSLFEILKDMSSGHPMNRLLQGDVGSGKTVVAAVAALLAAENGLQSAIMAPTEILAAQHYETIKKLFPDSEAKLGLLTSESAKIFMGEGWNRMSKNRRWRIWCLKIKWTSSSGPTPL